MKFAGLFFVACFSLMSCKTDLIFSERKYFENQEVLEFKADNSYEYYVRSENYVNKFSKGIWHQEGNKLFLSNGVLDPMKLPISYNTFSSEGTGTDVFINVLPKKQTNWKEELDVTDVINVDLVINQHVYPIKDMTSIVRLNDAGNVAYIRAYPKPESLHICEILNDTLRSEMIMLKPNSNLAIDIDCNPLYFAQITMSNDTVRIVNDRKIKWNKIYLERPN